MGNYERCQRRKLLVDALGFRDQTFGSRHRPVARLIDGGLEGACQIDGLVVANCRTKTKSGNVLFAKVFCFPVGIDVTND